MSYRSQASNRINVLDRIPEADKNNSFYPCGPVLQSIVDKGLTAYFPVRIINDSLSYFTIENVDLPSGSEVICDKNAEIRGQQPGLTSVLFSTSGSRSRINIHGGKWGYCENIWVHDNAGGPGGALSTSTFSNMEITWCKNNHAFLFDTMVGCTWANLVATSINTLGVFKFTGAGSVNSNLFIAPVWQNNTGVPLQFESGSTYNGNTILAGIIENNQKSGIVSEGGLINTKIIGTHFETNGQDVGDPDIVCRGVVRGLYISSVFATRTVSQESRVLIDNNVADAHFSDCSAIVDDKFFVETSHNESSLVFDRVYMQGFDTGDPLTYRDYSVALIKATGVGPYRYRGQFSGFLKNANPDQLVQVNY